MDVCIKSVIWMKLFTLDRQIILEKDNIIITKAYKNRIIVHIIHLPIKN